MPGNLGERLVSFAICIVGTVLLLQYAWQEVQPILVPVAVAGAVYVGCRRWLR